MNLHMITQKDIDIFWEEFAQENNTGYQASGCSQQNSYGAFSPKNPIDSVRSSILQEALKTVTGQRQVDYGTVEDNFQNIANLWNAYFRKETKGITNIKPTDVAAMMALMKIARLIHSPNHRDSWVDLAGYAACGAECGLKGATGNGGAIR